MFVRFLRWSSALRSGCAWLSAIVLTGCACSAPTHHPGLFNSTPYGVAVSELPTIDLALAWRSTWLGSPPGVHLFIDEKLMLRGWEEAKADFPVLAYMHPRQGDAAYRLEVDTAVHSDGNRLGIFLACGTLFVLPFDEHNALHVDARLYRGSQLVKTYKVRGELRVRYQLLLAAMPFLWHSRNAADLMSNAFRDLFIQVEKDIVESP